MPEALLRDLSAVPACAKVRICLQLKGVPFRRMPVSWLAMRRLRRTHAGAAPPVLRLGARRLIGARAILDVLEAEWPQPALVPGEREAYAYCRTLDGWADRVLGAAASAVVWRTPGVAEPVARSIADEIGPRALGPLLARWVTRQARQSQRMPLAAAEDALDEALGIMAVSLGERPYLLGSALSLADVAAYVHVARLVTLGCGRPVHARPRLAAWHERLASIDAVRTALVS